MRFLITNVTDGLGRSVAASLLAAGHDVVGTGDAALRELDRRITMHRGPATEVLDDVDAVLDLAGDTSLADTATRTVVLLPDDRGAERAWAANPTALLVRTAPLAGRRAGAAEVRTLAGLLAAPPTAPRQLVHPDDVARHLVIELTSGSATGTVVLAAPGTVTGQDVRRALRAAGIARDPRLTAPPAPSPLTADPAFHAGWTAADALADLVRGLQGRDVRDGGAVARPAEIPLPADVIPARLPAHDGHPLRSAAPEGCEGEFDEHIDPRFPVHSAANTSEALPGPLTALSIDVHAGALRRANAALAWMMGLEGLAAAEWTSRVNAVYGHHVFLNASISILTVANLPGWSEESMRRQAFASIPEDWAIYPEGRPETVSGLAAARAQAGVVRRLLGIARHLRTAAETVNAASRAEALDTGAIAALDDARLHAHARLARDRMAQAWTAAALGVVLVGAAENIHEKTSKAGAPAIPLERLESARTMLAVDRLAALMRTDSVLRDLAAAGEVDSALAHSPAAAAALGQELGRIGHRGPGECELANPVFADKPSLLLAAAAHAAAGPAHRRTGSGTATGRTARMVVGATVARERARDGVVRVNHRLRLIVRERGRRLVDAGVLGHPDDAVHLTLDELFAPPTDAAERVARRRTERDRLKALRMPDVFTGRWEPVGGSDRLAVDTSISGLGVSPGVAEGPVKILSDPDDDIEPGEILVASVTDVGYTSMFGYAAAVVTDIGGSASHAAIVAREYGVPCVVDTKLATARLQDGQIVRVDGTAGTITVVRDVVAPEPAPAL
jgi:phosphohistidine swiveling domain-containing protein